MTEVLLEWVPILERVLGPENPTSRERDNGEIKEEEKKKSLEMEDDDPDRQPCSADHGVGCQTESEHTSNLVEEESLTDSTLSSTALFAESSVAIVAPVAYTLPLDLLDDLSQLACLYLDLGCPGGAGDGELERVCVFLRRFFFLLDKERVRKMCTLRFREQPDVLNTYVACMLGECSFSFPPSRHFQYTPTLTSTRVRGLVGSTLFNTLLVSDSTSFYSNWNLKRKTNSPTIL